MATKVAVTPARAAPNSTEPVAPVPLTAMVIATTEPSRSATAPSTDRTTVVAVEERTGPASRRSVRWRSSSPRSSRVVVRIAQTARMTWMTQPPSQTAKPPGVPRATGTPCIILIAGLSSNIWNCWGETPFG